MRVTGIGWWADYPNDCCRLVPLLVRCREKHKLEVHGPLLLDDQSLMLEAALAGAGLSYLSEWAGAEHVAAGCLLRVVEDWMPITLPVLVLPAKP